MHEGDTKTKQKWTKETQKLKRKGRETHKTNHSEEERRTKQTETWRKTKTKTKEKWTRRHKN